MKIEELRIGNFVHCVDGSKEAVHDDDTRIVATITMLQENPKVISWELKGYNFTPFEKHDIVGIPLTEEWLKRMGIKMQHKSQSINVGGELFDFIVIGKEPNAYCLWYREGKGFTLDSVARRDTRYWQYVHEIQNVVFALTGTELTIQENQF